MKRLLLLAALLAPSVSAANQKSCEDAAAVYRDFAQTRDAGVSRSAVELVIANDTRYDSAIKLAQLRFLSKIYSNAALSPDGIYSSFMGNCMSSAKAKN